jgi:hypothetical protein
MLHCKVIGLTWLVLSLVAAAVFAPQLWSMATDSKYGLGTGFRGAGFWVSQFLVEGFLLFSVLVGFGLFRFRRWAAICLRITAVVPLLYCLAFLLMGEFIHYHWAWVIAGLFGLAFAVYSLLVVWRFRPYDRIV